MINKHDNPIHPELYTYFENTEEWEERFLKPELRSENWELYLQEELLNIYKVLLEKESNPIRIRVLEKSIEEFKLSGIDINEAQQKEFNTNKQHDLSIELTRLSTQDQSKDSCRQTCRHLRHPCDLRTSWLQLSPQT